MRDPFVITGPTTLSFSGGSTSAFMLKQVLRSNPVGVLKKWLRVMFANTGLEHEKTLKFVNDCDVHWMRPHGMAVEWLEFRDDERGYDIVNYSTASRSGEPFIALVKKRNYLPNPITRFCTSELKIRTMHRRIRALEWHDEDGEWEQCVGIRADEPRRVSKIRSRGRSTESKHEHMRMPLADAGCGYKDVDDFWETQPFKLELPRINGRTLAGNCVLCFLKPRKQIQSLMVNEPKEAKTIIWIGMETATVQTIKPRYVETGFFAENGDPLLKLAPSDGAFFRNDRPSYRQMLDFMTSQGDLFEDVDPDEEGIACFCGD